MLFLKPKPIANIFKLGGFYDVIFLFHSFPENSVAQT